jgi:hypothetical protein
VSVWLDDTLVLDHAAITVSCGYGRVTEVTPGLFCIASNTSNAVESRVDNLVISVK